MTALILTTVLVTTTHADPDETIAPPQRVVVISLDGARPDAILQTQTPNIQGLARRGASTWTASTVYPSVTLIAHASMLTGVSIEEHGVDHNDSFLYPCPAMETPTFITTAQQAGYSTAMVVGKERFCHFHQSEATDYTFARSGDRSVVDRVLELLDEGVEVIFAHFPNPDYFGHSTNWMSDVYLYQMSSTDAEVGRILAKLDDLGITDETLVILTSDHGGHGDEHGLDIPEDMLVPFIIAGPGVLEGVTLMGEIEVPDVAATVLWALGLPLPESEVSRPITEAFGVPSTAVAVID